MSFYAMNTSFLKAEQHLPSILTSSNPALARVILVVVGSQQHALMRALQLTRCGLLYSYDWFIFDIAFLSPTRYLSGPEYGTPSLSSPAYDVRLD